jgi:phosphate transport system permease protein
MPEMTAPIAADEVSIVTADDGATAPPPQDPFDVPRSVGSRSKDDIAALIGAGAASLAMTWLLYDNILPTAGIVGFFIVWYIAFVGLYALVLTPNHPRPVVIDKVSAALVTAGATVVAGALVWTVVYVFWKGAPALDHWNFYSKDMSAVSPTSPFSQGGIAHAVVGSVIEVAIAVAISVPAGIGTAIYMTEVGGRFSKVVRTVVEAMTALPDLVAGLFIYTFLIVDVPKFFPSASRTFASTNGFAAALALSITMLPIVARSSEVVLRVVPGGLREAGLALGSSQWSTVRRVVLPTARPGLATAVILGIARGIGETAPVLITSGASSFFNTNPFKSPMNSLPLYAYTGIRSGEGPFVTRGFGAAAVLLLVVVILFISIRLLARQRTSR